VVQGLTGDLSCTGVRLWTGTRLNVQPGDAVRIVLPVLDGDASLPATVVRVEDESLRAQFDALSLAEEEALTMVLYSRADTWLGWDQSRQGDHPVRSFARIVRLAARGFRQTLAPGKRSRDAGLMTSIAPLLIAAVLLPAWSRATGQEAKDPAPVAVTAMAPEKDAQQSTKAEPPKIESQAPVKKVDGVTGDAQAPAPSKATKETSATDKPVASLSGTQKTDDSDDSDTDAAADSKAGKTPGTPVHASAAHTAVAKSIASAVSAPVASAKFVPPAPARVSPVIPTPVVPTATQSSNQAGVGPQYVVFYRSRVLPAWWRASVIAAQYPWALLVLVVLQTFLISVLLRASLRRRARERLLGHI
jgi:hypothetical protein